MQGSNSYQLPISTIRTSHFYLDTKPADHSIFHIPVYYLPIFYNAREYYDHIMHFDQIERDQKYFMDYYFGCLPWQWLLRKPKKKESLRNILEYSGKNK